MLFHLISPDKLGDHEINTGNHEWQSPSCSSCFFPIFKVFNITRKSVYKYFIKYCGKTYFPKK